LDIQSIKELSLISLEAERLLGTFEQMEELDFGAKDIGYPI
jgi:hypothetical protein